jgi:enoyl-CoA hydratase
MASTDEPTRPPVLYDLMEAGRVAVITLNRPERLNAYDTGMRDAMFEALCAVRDDPQVRAVVMCGAGRAFSTGGDLREFGSAPSPVRAREVRWLRDVWGTLWHLPAITIAAVHGFTVGGGFEMAMLCDRCIAAADARFSLPETGLGMIPGVGGTQTLPRLVGIGRAQSLVLAGQWIDARTAERLGLAARVVPPARLLASALGEARRIARLEPEMVRAVKRAVCDGLDRPLDAGLALERRLSAELAAADRRSRAAAYRVPHAGRGRRPAIDHRSNP